eukprot:2142128-Amphidinium_carterae.1
MKVAINFDADMCIQAGIQGVKARPTQDTTYQTRQKTDSERIASDIRIEAAGFSTNRCLPHGNQ